MCSPRSASRRTRSRSDTMPTMWRPSSLTTSAPTPRSRSSSAASATVAAGRDRGHRRTLGGEDSRDSHGRPPRFGTYTRVWTTTTRCVTRHVRSRLRWLRTRGSPRETASSWEPPPTGPGPRRLHRPPPPQARLRADEAAVGWPAHRRAIACGRRSVLGVGVGAAGCAPRGWWAGGSSGAGRVPRSPAAALGAAAGLAVVVAVGRTSVEDAPT